MKRPFIKSKGNRRGSPMPANDFVLKMVSVSPRKRRLELEAAPTLVTQVQAVVHRVLNGAEPAPAAERPPPRPPRRTPRVRPVRPAAPTGPLLRCQFCSNPFAPQGFGQKFCSPDCRRKFHATTHSPANGAAAGPSSEAR